ncbi:hypothetical protein L0244_36715 [bacterium]|nr:hypothetical protein [bacterium]
MAREKVQFQGSADDVIGKANIYLKGKPGWEPIQLTYSSHKNLQTLAFTADSKMFSSKEWQFVKTLDFRTINGTKEVGVFYENDTPWYVGVPVK